MQIQNLTCDEDKVVIDGWESPGSVQAMPSHANTCNGNQVPHLFLHTGHLPLLFQFTAATIFTVAITTSKQAGQNSGGSGGMEKEVEDSSSLVPVSSEHMFLKKCPGNERGRGCKG